MNKQKEITRFNLHLPSELHTRVKAHAALKCEPLNNWIIRCIVEQVEREKTYITVK
jgi:predicted HicB family RNase H-like nuclease